MSDEARDVRSLVQRMLDDDQTLDAGAGVLVLAALDEDAALASELGGESAPESSDGAIETPGERTMDTRRFSTVLRDD